MSTGRLKRFDIIKKKLIVVEGVDDCQFMQALVNDFHSAPSDIQIHNTRGVDKIRKHIRVLATLERFPDLETLLIVRDAHENPQGAFKSARDGLDEIELEPPTAPFEWGGSSPRTCIAILPGAHDQGSLEDLCLRALEGSEEMECVSFFIECLGLLGHPQVHKMQTAAYLAGKDRPGMSVGVAALEHVWPLEHRAFCQLRSVVEAL